MMHVRDVLTPPEPERRDRGKVRMPSSFPTDADFMPLRDRNVRARVLAFAEALDRRTRQPGQHGGALKRTGLAVLRALLLTFMSQTTGRCDPSLDTLAAAAGVSRSTCVVALDRLMRAGVIAWTRRMVRVREAGITYLRQTSNAYRVVGALPVHQAVRSVEKAESEFRAQSYERILSPLPAALADALARLGHAIADYEEAPKRA